jgi:predicted aldo/keto reductase-like oxidoreductase
MLSALGVGTSRFSVETEADIEKNVEIVSMAINNGVNYIDVASRYSGGKAEEIVRKAISLTKKNTYLTVKAGNGIERTADAAYSRICSSLENLQVGKVTFFVLWSLKSYTELLESIKTGGIYEGALKAKNDGLIEHICVSLHAPTNDALKIIKSGLFEGITISYSVMNQEVMQPILDTAADLKIGVITMNTLGGGLIPQNPDFFSFVKKNDESISQSSLAYVYAHPQITTMLSAMVTPHELNENLKAVECQETAGESKGRIVEINNKIKQLTGYCTGCKYCEGCPQGINIPEMMQSYNTLFFKSDSDSLFYHRTDKRILENISICKKLNQSFSYIPEDHNNPCVNCGNCEKYCTQSIPIIKRIAELYTRFKESAYSKQDIRERIMRLMTNDYKKIALYPSTQYIGVFLGYVHTIFPNFDKELFLFDKNEKLWGSDNSGIIVRNPESILTIKPDVIFIANYRYEEEIFNSLKELENKGIPVVKLHKHGDVPWFF